MPIYRSKSNKTKEQSSQMLTYILKNLHIANALCLFKNVFAHNLLVKHKYVYFKIDKVQYLTNA